MFTLILAALFACSVAVAQLVVTQPTAEHWWVGGGLNTLAWTGTSPPDFQVFLVNPDRNVLTDRLALESIVPTYIKSKSINPGGATPAKGYTLELTNPLNSTDVYATSEAFEIKAPNSPYPPQSTDATGASSPSSSGNSSTASVSASASASATDSPNGAERHVSSAHGVSLVLGLAVFGWSMTTIE